MVTTSEKNKERNKVNNNNNKEDGGREGGDGVATKNRITLFPSLGPHRVHVNYPRLH